MVLWERVSGLPTATSAETVGNYLKCGQRSSLHWENYYSPHIQFLARALNWYALPLIVPINCQGSQRIHTCHIIFNRYRSTVKHCPTKTILNIYKTGILINISKQHFITNLQKQTGQHKRSEQ